MYLFYIILTNKSWKLFRMINIIACIMFAIHNYILKNCILKIQGTWRLDRLNSCTLSIMNWNVTLSLLFVANKILMQILFVTSEIFWECEWQAKKKKWVVTNISFNSKVYCIKYWEAASDIITECIRGSSQSHLLSISWGTLEIFHFLRRPYLYNSLPLSLLESAS